MTSLLKHFIPTLKNMKVFIMLATKLWPKTRPTVLVNEGLDLDLDL